MNPGTLVRYVVLIAGLIALVVLPPGGLWTAVSELAAAPSPKTIRATPRADFNGDGFADLAIGVPGENVGSIVDAGAIQVLYGSSTGLTAVNEQFWTQDSPGMEDSAESYESFGRALAAGDFNADGFADLAVGVPIESVGYVDYAGAVQVLYGSSAGLTAADDQFWTQNSPDMKDPAEYHDLFGYAVAAGDFNADGFADLAVGVPGEDLGYVFYAGAVQVLFGSPAGLTAAGAQFWTQDSPGMKDTAESYDWFGRPLAAGDFNADGFSDLAVGVPSESLSEPSKPGYAIAAGAVQVLYGSSAGLTAADDQFWTQDSPGIEDTAETYDHVGGALVAGDFNADGFADLGMGASGEGFDTKSRSGAVNVLYGSATGLSAANNQFWTQDSSGIRGSTERSDAFGSALASGDLNGDGVTDIAVGVPGESVKGVSGAGAVNVLYGSAAGLASANNQIWTQDRQGVHDAAEPGDRFGGALAGR